MIPFSTLPLSLLALIVTAAAQNLNETSIVDYAPNINVPCPSEPLIRVFTPQNQSLNTFEKAFVDNREKTTISQAWYAWLGNGSAIGYNLSALASAFPRVGISTSGGGYRAAQLGAGVLSGLDARNESALAAGTGGLLQVATYLSALSGGSWLTGSLFFNNFPTIRDLVYGDNNNLSGWILDLPLASPDGDNLFSTDNQYFYGSILYSVEAKANKSIDTSITDPWARMISYHFLNQTTRNNFFNNNTAHGAGQLWSNIPQIPAFQSFETPFPVLCTDSRPVGSNYTTALPPEPVVYEITPFEFGSWDPNLSAMMNISYAGTNLNNGKPANSSACVTAFDQAGFMMGTSASLFNQILDFATNTLSGFSSDDGAALAYVLSRQLRDVRTRADDVANWPNPFQGIKPDTFEDSNSSWLELIDGSSNLENIPMGQLFVNVRAVDVVVAIDASADDPVNEWPNGTSPIFTSNRISTLLQTSHQQFPPIPSNTSEWIEFGINARPTFFGCDPTLNPPEWPFVIYFPNAPPLNGDDPVTNTGTFKISYTEKFTQIFLDQAHNNTLGGFVPNATGADPNWGKCLQCAAIDRSRFKLNPVPSRSSVCSACFTQYCFDPAHPPSKSELVGRKLVNVDPDPTGVSQVEDFLEDNKGPLIGGLVALFVLIGVAIAFLLWWRKRKQQKLAYEAVHDDDIDAWADHGYVGYARPASYELARRESRGSYVSNISEVSREAPSVRPAGSPELH